jgi:NAD(P)-dependent dehydrogenase (short-subunit alcohol dehydrogenase family)
MEQADYRGRRVIVTGSSSGIGCPAVQTPMLEAIEKVFPAEMLDAVTHPVGRRSTPDEQVGPLLFLNSAGASYVNGVDLQVDGGFWAAQSVAGRSS